MAETFGVAASALAVVELAAKVVEACAQYTTGVLNARRDVERVVVEVKGLGDVAGSVRHLSDKFPEQQRGALQKLQPLVASSELRLAELQAALEPGKRKTVMRKLGVRALTWPFKSKETEEMLAELARLTQAIAVAMQVDQTTMLLDMDQKRALEKLPVANGAAYDSHADEHDPQCLPDTRTEILQEISQWAQDPNSKSVFWLNGMAGTGKSTISRTLAYRFAEQGALGATFFFKRGESDRGGISKLLTTISSQLILQVPGIAKHVQAAIEADPSIFSKALREQFHSLIMNPVSKISSDTSATHSRLIIIDALDECEQEESIQTLIKLLSGIQPIQNLQLKFFLTSRPELPIRLGFQVVDGTYQNLILHEVANPVIEHDITVYFTHELARVKGRFNLSVPEDQQLSEDWPSETDLHILVQMAIPLFIFAATVCRFISDGRVAGPDHQLQEVLRYQTKSQESQLDATYLPVLNQLVVGLSPRTRNFVIERFHKVIGSIIILASPLSAFSLAHLLNLPETAINDALMTMHSVLSVPKSSRQPVRLLHLSFHDFLVDPERQKELFWVDEKETHRQLAFQCLRILNSSLKNDLCEVRAPGTSMSSISEHQINTKLPAELQYACRYWVHHLRESATELADIAEVWDFCSTHFLQWLEALSWMGRLPESLGMVKALQEIFPSGKYQEMSNFLNDAVRFILAASSAIQTAPLQIYSSALAFSPSESIVRSLYQRDLARWLTLTPKVPSFWGQRLQTLEGHSMRAFSVAFSPDGRLIASGSEDAAVVLWAADTGERRQTLEGHLEAVLSVAFSPDSKLVASVSVDATIILWTADTGKRLRMLEGHGEWIHSAVFSPDGKLIVAASINAVILWAADTGKRLRTLHGHAEPINSVACSPDGKLIAATSSNAVIFWAADTGKHLRTLERHTGNINLLVFSPDGKSVASASSNVVIFWAADTGKRLRTLKGHTEPINSVAFSPDNKSVASASDDQTVIIWAADTGKRLRTLKGHTRPISSVAFSPDGKLVASASADLTIILWEVDTNERRQIFEGHENSIFSLAVSPSGAMVATTSLDNMILWSAETGEFQQSFEKRQGLMTSTVFSPDGKSIAFVVTDMVITLWNIDTGERRAMSGHKKRIQSLEFSPDGKLVASASLDYTVMLWVVDTGECRQTFYGHSNGIQSVVFSFDGKLMASASFDGTVMLWVVDTGERLRTLITKYGMSSSVAFSPDNKLVALATDYNTILWVVDTGERLQTFTGLSSSIESSSIAFSPDNRLLASATNSGSVAIWDINSGEKQQTLYIGTISRNVQFDVSARHILTDVGMFAIHTSSTDPPDEVSVISALTTDFSEPPNVNLVGYGISRDRCWICLGDEKILFLPPEYRPERSAILGSTVIIGCTSGKVLIMRLDWHDEKLAGRRE